MSSNSLPGAFLPETAIFDTQEVFRTDVTSDAFKELLVRLHQRVNEIAMIVNVKDSGYYVEEQFVNGQRWFKPGTPLSGKDANFRQVVRTVVDFGALPNSGSKTVAHGIPTSQNFSFTRIFGTATDPGASTITSAIPLPYVNVAAPADGVQLAVDATNVTITTTSGNYTPYTACYVVLEWIQE